MTWLPKLVWKIKDIITKNRNNKAITSTHIQVNKNTTHKQHGKTHKQSQHTKHKDRQQTNQKNEKQNKQNKYKKVRSNNTNVNKT